MEELWLLSPYETRWAERFWRFVDTEGLLKWIKPPSADLRKPRDRLQELLALLEDQQVPYLSEDAKKPRLGGQTVRDPLVVSAEGATCIEMVAVTAAACLAAGIHPWAVFGANPTLDGHTWLVVDVENNYAEHGFDGKKAPPRYPEQLGYWEAREERSRSEDKPQLIEDAEELKRLTTEYPARYLVVDCVLLCTGYPKGEARDSILSVSHGDSLFSGYEKLSCCDIGWWWSSRWIRERPDEVSPGRFDRGGRLARVRRWIRKRLGEVSPDSVEHEECDPLAGSAGERVPSRQTARPTASLATRDGIHVSAIRTVGGLELREIAEGADGPFVAASPDGRVVATVVEGAIELAWVNPFSAELTHWERRPLHSCDPSVRVLAISRRGEIGALAVVSDATSTWLVEVDPSGPVRFEQIATGPATAAAIVRGAPWILADGQLQTPLGHPFAPRSTVLDIDVAGGVGNEVLALLLCGEGRTEVHVIQGLMHEWRLTTPWDVPEGTTNISIVRELDPARTPCSLQYGTGEEPLTWEPLSPVGEAPASAIGASNGP